MSLKKLGLAALLSLAALPAAAQTQVVRIAATPGPHAQILEAVKPIAAKKGIELKIIEFSDYVVPNAALAATAWPPPWRRASCSTSCARCLTVTWRCR